jgi:CheY-like chemotaxis protein
VSESLKESASPWFQSKVVPWEAEVTLPRLLFVFFEDIDLAIPASGDVLDHSKVIVLFPNKEGVICPRIAASEDSTAHFGPVTPSSLQDALARLYPDLVPASNTHGPLSSSSGNVNDRETTHNEKPGNELATSRTNNSLPGPVGLTLEVPYRNGPDRSPGKSPELRDQEPPRLSSPVRTSNTDVPDRPEISTQAPSIETLEPARTEPKLLLVDDNSINLKVISMFARKASSKPPTSVSSGREAIDTFEEALASGPYDLIFLDLSMPEMSGFEVAEKIRKIEANTPHQMRTYICALTALVSADDQNRAYAAGVDEYVVKPANLGDLKDVINRWRERAQN